MVSSKNSAENQGEILVVRIILRLLFSLDINLPDFRFPGVTGKYVDIVKDVINAVVVDWAAEKLVGLPIPSF